MKDIEQIVDEVYRSWNADQYGSVAPVIRAMLRDAVREARSHKQPTMRDRVKRDLDNGEYNPPKDPDMRERYAELWGDPNGVDQ